MASVVFSPFLVCVKETSGLVISCLRNDLFAGEFGWGEVVLSRRVGGLVAALC